MPHEERWLIAKNRESGEKVCHHCKIYSDQEETDFKRTVQNRWGINADIVYSSQGAAPKYDIEYI